MGAMTSFAPQMHSPFSKVQFVAIICVFRSVSQRVKDAARYEYFAAGSAMLAFGQTRFGASRSDSFVDDFGMTEFCDCFCLCLLTGCTSVGFHARFGTGGLRSDATAVPCMGNGLAIAARAACFMVRCVNFAITIGVSRCGKGGSDSRIGCDIR